MGGNVGHVSAGVPAGRVKNKGRDKSRPLFFLLYAGEDACAPMSGVPMSGYASPNFRKFVRHVVKQLRD